MTSAKAERCAADVARDDDLPHDDGTAGNCERGDAMRFFSNRFAARTVVAGIMGTSVPLAVVGPYLLLRPQGVDWTLLIMLGLSTLAGIAGATIRLRREATPVIRISNSLCDFADGGDWQPVPCNPGDAVGRLSAAAQKLAGTVEALERRCEEASRKDALTGLPDRPAFLRTVADRPPASLALIGVDRLKEINSLYDHQTGDAALRGVAEVLQAELGPKDCVGRWSGDEFILYLDEADPDRARETLEAMREAVASNAQIAPHRLTVSAGLVAMSGSIDLDSAAAEELLHAAREAGRNRVMTPMFAIDGGAGGLRDLTDAFDTQRLLSGT